MGPIPSPRAPKLGRGKRHAHKIPRVVVKRTSTHAYGRTGALSQTHLGAPTDDVAVLLGGGAGGGAQIGPGRHGSRSRMFRPRAPGGVRRRPESPAGRLGFGVWAPTEEF